MIGKSAFAGCKSLCRLSLPASLKRIEKDAFQDCEALPELVIPNGCEVHPKAFSR
ncbi:MAG: leucine-rich repeat protein [Oscillospiraceae bacterium]|nr:leucine-rich repeat protein [Oscillospiraceae bacterium]